MTDSKTKFVVVGGARPNFMKIAPLARVISERNDSELFLVHTGQHYDFGMSDVFFTDLGIRAPDAFLNIGSLPRSEQIVAVETKFAELLEKQTASVIVVVGDVNSTVACARVGKAHGIPVAHVEAGLRSFDDRMPEEHNRIETDGLSDFLYVTEQSGMDNLERESVPGKRFLVGNVMIDTLQANLPRVQASTKHQELMLRPKEYFVATFHRPSNVDTKESLLAILETIERVTVLRPLVLPLHPRTKHSLERFGLLERTQQIQQLILTEPLGYFDFMGLVLHSAAVITDSGGIQEETTYLGIPCLTMRENTERPVTITMGTNVLVGGNQERIIEELKKIQAGTFHTGHIPPFWDGHAAERIVESLLEELR